jgi:hypothetical protein
MGPVLSTIDPADIRYRVARDRVLLSTMRLLLSGARASHAQATRPRREDLMFGDSPLADCSSRTSSAFE